MARNPYHDPRPVLAREKVLERILRIVVSHLRARSGDATIPDAQVRAFHPALANDTVWAAVQKRLGL
jgi:hypothetical protein